MTRQVRCFRGCKFSVFTGGQLVRQVETANTFPVQADNLVAHSMEHALYLVITALKYGHPGFGRSQHFESGRGGGQAFVGKPDTFSKSLPG